MSQDSTWKREDFDTGFVAKCHGMILRRLLAKNAGACRQTIEDAAAEGIKYALEQVDQLRTYHNPQGGFYEAAVRAGVRFLNREKAISARLVHCDLTIIVECRANPSDVGSPTGDLSAQTGENANDESVQPDGTAALWNSDADVLPALNCIRMTLPSLYKKLIGPYRHAIALKMQGKNYREIQAITGIPRSTLCDLFGELKMRLGYRKSRKQSRRR
jgi:DNA-directed RNA polymerase specialized sigma24 family protein